MVSAVMLKVNNILHTVHIRITVTRLHFYGFSIAPLSYFYCTSIIHFYRTCMLGYFLLVLYLVQSCSGLFLVLMLKAVISSISCCM